MQTTTAMRTGKNGFEITTCGRCAGSGRYSFNLMDGDRCYGCNGSTVKLTKRGQAAHDFYFASLQRNASEVKIGEYVRDSRSGKMVQVIDIRTDGARALVNGEWVSYVSIETATMIHNVLPGSRVSSVANMDELKAKHAAALAHQATLTKTGTARKNVMMVAA